MIKTIDVECNAANPNLPLKPMFAFVNSPSSIRVRNVPKRIGDWCIRKVYFTAVYPDSIVKTAECVLTGGVWVGTIEGTNTSGTSKNGYTIFADGTDENGNNVTGYILGKGDIEILEADGTLSPDPARYYVKLLSAEATEPREGDMYPTEDGYVIWQDGQANLLGTPFEQITAYVDSALSSKADLSAIHGDYIEDADGNKIYADRTVEVVEQGEQSWTLTDGTNTYTLTGTRLNSMWETESERYTLVGQEDEGNNAGAWTLKYETPLPGMPIWVTQWTEFYNGTFGEQSLTFPTHGFTATWDDGRTLTEDELALKSDLSAKADLSAIPSNTSQLSNDSGFITSAEIEPYHDVLTPNVNTGVAKQAMSIALHESNSLKPNSFLAAKVETNLDLTDEFTAAMEYVTYHPYNLEKYFEQTFSPAVELKFCNGRIAYMAGSKPRIIYTGYMFRTGGAGFAMPCSEDGIPDGRLYETTDVMTIAAIIADQTTSLHQLTFTARYNDPYGQVATVDGQSEQMTCWRINAYKAYVIYEEIANKSDLPTKTSELSNDSGYITSSDIHSDYIEDTNGNKINADRNIVEVDLTTPWTVYEEPPYTMDYNQQLSVWEYIYEASNKNILYYNSTDGQWIMDYFLWSDGGWIPAASNYATGTMYDQSIYFPESGMTVTRTTHFTGKLATQNWVLEQLSALEARIAALENS